jgi:hypothetical protein
MVYYRLYSFNNQGHIDQAIDLDFEDDASAIESAARLAGGAPMELWQHARCVCIFPQPEGESVVG